MAEPLMETPPRAADGEHAARLARLIREQFSFIWRLLRRIGVSEGEVDGAVQEVFAAAAQRIGDIRPGSERSFLFSTTLHVAAQVRKQRSEQASLNDSALALEDLDEGQQAREVLGALLEQMPLELRVVFVLHEVEQLQISQIAETAGIPPSVVSARLSEARDEFATHLESESDYSLALIAAAREEQAPEGALSRALEAAGLSPAAVLADADFGASIHVGEKAARGPARTRSPVALAAKWLVVGWLAGLVLGSLLSALRDAAATPAEHGTTR